MSSQIGWPEGASAEWPQRHAERLADDLRRRRGSKELTASARRRAGAAPDIGRMFERDLPVREPRADRLHAAGVFSFDRQQRDAAGHEHAGKIAASPRAPSSSRAAPCRTSRRPCTPRRVGSDRISRRKIVAASLRYGRLSNMAVVPCDRPSHGSVHDAANGTAPAT